MLLNIIHTTDLTYSDLINESVMELRMAPRQELDQHRLSFRLAIGPRAQASSYFDWLGNTVHAFTIGPFHQQIRIVATSVVEIDRARPEPQRFEDRWPIPPDSLDYLTYDYLHFRGPVVDTPMLHDLVGVVGPRQGESVGEIALRMLHLIDDRFTYQKGVTTSASPITEILTHGRGVCQDFTHLMIGLARLMKIPARYVSGFIHRDGDRYRGYTQSHAWCELFFPTAGWIGFDPTNNAIVGKNFCKVAIGRDFIDVPPNKGVYRGTAKENINVTVETQELAQIPHALAAERYEGLDLELFPDGPMNNREMIVQQQQQQQEREQQQQQQQQLKIAGTF